MIDTLVGVVAGSSSVGALWIWHTLMPNAKVRRLIRRRYAVTLKGGEGSFAGLLVEKDYETLVFEGCMTVAQGPNDTTQSIPGRVRVESENVAYLQELSNDLV